MLFSDTFPVPHQPAEDRNWPPSWRESYHYDRLEVWEERSRAKMASVGYVWSYASRRKITIDAVLAACPPPARVLDLASAQGNFAIALAGLGYRVTWNDLREELADYVRLKLPPNAELDFVTGNIFELESTHTGAYDVVLALEVIEHVAHPDAFMLKLGSLLRPSGVLVLSTPNGGYLLNDLPRFSDCPDPSVFETMQFKPNSDGHIFLLYEDEIRKFAQQADLEVTRLDLVTSPLTAGHLKLRYLLSVLPDWSVEKLEKLARRLPDGLRRRLSVHLVAVLAKGNHKLGHECTRA